MLPLRNRLGVAAKQFAKQLFGKGSRQLQQRQNGGGITAAQPPAGYAELALQRAFSINLRLLNETQPSATIVKALTNIQAVAESGVKTQKQKTTRLIVPDTVLQKLEKILWEKKGEEYFKVLVAMGSMLQLFRSSHGVRRLGDSAYFQLTAPDVTLPPDHYAEIFKTLHSLEVPASKIYDLLITRTAPSVIHQLSPASCRSLGYTYLQLKKSSSESTQKDPFLTQLLERLTHLSDTFQESDVRGTLGFLARLHIMHEPLIKSCVEYIASTHKVFSIPELVRSLRSLLVLNYYDSHLVKAVASRLTDNQIEVPSEALCSMIMTCVNHEISAEDSQCPTLVFKALQQAKKLDVRQLTIVLYGLCYYKMTDHAAQLKNVLQDKIFPVFTHNAPQTRIIPIITEVLESAAREFHIALQAPETVVASRTALARRGSFHAFTQHIAKILEHLQKLDARFQFAPKIPVGPYVPQFVDVRLGVVLETYLLHGLGPGLRRRHYKDLGYKLITLSQSRFPVCLSIAEQTSFLQNILLQKTEEPNQTSG